MAVTKLSDAHVWADDDFLEALVDLKLDTLSGVFAYAGKGHMRAHANRDNFHVVHTLRDRDYDLYFKRHKGFEVKEALKLLASRSPFLTAGRREWENISLIERLGIPTMRPVAFGEQRLACFELKSFLITEAIPNAIPMDDYIRKHFSGRPGADAVREKRALLWDLGGLVRRLHAARLTHMDLYLNHIFVRETPESEKVLHLIDLQRVARRWFAPRRWIVKDLAALVFSGRGLPLSRTDYARVFMAYFGGKLSARDRRLVARALDRARAMALRHPLPPA